MLTLMNITVEENRVRARFSCNAEQETLSEAALQELFWQFPHLSQQECLEGNGNHMHAVAAHSFGQGPLPSAAHAVEHVALELLYQDAQQRGVPQEGKLTGVTRRIDDGLYEVALSFFDDLRTMAALQQATEAVNQAMEDTTSELRQ